MRRTERILRGCNFNLLIEREESDDGTIVEIIATEGRQWQSLQLSHLILTGRAEANELIALLATAVELADTLEQKGGITSWRATPKCPRFSDVQTRVGSDEPDSVQPPL